jgi:VWFA-related protein
MSGRFRLVVPAAVLALLVVLAPSGRARSAGQEPQAPPQKPAAPQQRAPQGQPPQQAPVQQSPQQAQQPTFRVGVNFVRVDVIITDKQGNAVPDLTQNDFEVLEDGKPQTIETFRFIKVSGNPEPGGEVPREIRTPSDQEIEAARDDVRLFVFFLDDYHVRRSNSMVVRTPLSDFITKQLGPMDLVALMYPLTPVDDVQFTRDHQKIVRAIEHFDGRKYDYRPVNDFEEKYAYYPAAVVERIRNEVVFSALAGLVTHLGSLREGRKTVILVSEGYTNILPPQLNDPIAAMPGLGNPNRGQPRTGEPSTAEDRARFFAEADLQTELREVYDAANRNNTAIYALDPRGLAPFEFDINEGVEFRTDHQTLEASLDTLRVLAGETDGRAIINRNDLEAGLKQVVRDSAAYYLLGYNSKAAPADGKFHEIRVRLKRSGLQVRARKGYWAPTVEDMARASAPPKPGPPPAVSTALSSIVDPPRGRYIRSWLGTSRGENGKTRVTFVWEPLPPPPGTDREPPTQVSLVAVGKGRAPYFRGRVPDTSVTITEGAAGAPSTKARRGPYRVAFEAPPGPMELRINVQGSDNRLVDAETRTVVVPDLTVPQLALSTPSVFRASNAREFREIAGDPGAVPTASRDFLRTERLLVRVDVYSPGNSVPTVAARLLNREGTRMADVGVRAPSDARGPYEIDLPLSGLAKGEYLLEIAASGESGKTSQLIPMRVTG